jgi:hypothetical protein
MCLVCLYACFTADGFFVFYLSRFGVCVFCLFTGNCRRLRSLRLDFNRIHRTGNDRNDRNDRNDHNDSCTNSPSCSDFPPDQQEYNAGGRASG